MLARFFSPILLVALCLNCCRLVAQDSLLQVLDGEIEERALRLAEKSKGIEPIRAQLAEQRDAS